MGTRSWINVGVSYLIFFVFGTVSGSDSESSDQVLSPGGITALVLVITFLIILLASCIYQAKKDQSRHDIRVLRCGGCRRAFRVPSPVANAEFMCSRCVTQNRRRMSAVLEEERVARFSRMRESANKPVKLERVTSTFFKLARSNTRNLAKANVDSPQPPTSHTSPVKRDSENRTECKICFDDESCIVLVPCGHSGLCEGCAKDLVSATKECYICRSEINLIAKVKKPGGKITTAIPDGDTINSSQNMDTTLTEPSCSSVQPMGPLRTKQLSAVFVSPESLHHLTSRSNTSDEGFASAPSGCTCAISHSSLEMAISRRLSTRPYPISEETDDQTDDHQLTVVQTV